ncbi:putative T7SS-secreted protein [Amycolatopsis sp. GM8]|uniref:putative T7SS-secreted protein n=1 Tax=Amycolatopsis sp. GM8 TaxID=2896530 RepID=UPI002714EEB5|nr:NucA/NucB deoxyribonuclease domain-containing protein [Amycolatopsis sp. GM8]
MAELGDTTDPKQLVPGEPGEIRKSIAHLVVCGNKMVQTGDGLKTLDTGGWTGGAADAYHERFDTEPGRWTIAGDAFHAAAQAIEGYTATLEWAQGQAREAIGIYQQGEQATQQAQAQHNQAVAVATQQAAAAGQPAPAQPPFTDPGEAARTQAQQMLDRARAQLITAGDQAVATIDKAQEHAPQTPTLLDDLTDGFTSAVDWMGDQAAGVVHSAGATIRGAADLAGHFASDVVITATNFGSDMVDAAGNLSGHVLGAVGLDDAANTVTSSTHEASEDIHRAGQSAAHAADTAMHDAGTTASGWVDHIANDINDQQPKPTGPQYVIVDQGDYPEAANHVREAQMGTSWRGDVPFPRTQPMEVTLDREGAEERRDESMKQVPQTKPGYDRDEYPPAMFAEGGEGSSVKYIDPFDNRGAGSSIRHQTAGLDNGEKVIILAD